MLRIGWNGRKLPNWNGPDSPCRWHQKPFRAPASALQALAIAMNAGRLRVAGSTLLIVLLGWDDTPNATSWVFCVANASWCEMDVAMEDGLPILFAGVDSYLLSVI